MYSSSNPKFSAWTTPTASKICSKIWRCPWTMSSTTIWNRRSVFRKFRWRSRVCSTRASWVSLNNSTFSPEFWQSMTSAKYIERWPAIRSFQISQSGFPTKNFWRHSWEFRSKANRSSTKFTREWHRRTRTSPRPRRKGYCRPSNRTTISKIPPAAMGPTTRPRECSKMFRRELSKDFFRSCSWARTERN